MAQPQSSSAMMSYDEFRDMLRRKRKRCPAKYALPQPIESSQPVKRRAGESADHKASSSSSKTGSMTLTQIQTLPHTVSYVQTTAMPDHVTDAKQNRSACTTLATATLGTTQSAAGSTATAAAAAATATATATATAADESDSASDQNQTCCSIYSFIAGHSHHKGQLVMSADGTPINLQSLLLCRDSNNEKDSNAMWICLPSTDAKLNADVDIQNLPTTVAAEDLSECDEPSSTSVCAHEHSILGHMPARLAALVAPLYDAKVISSHIVFDYPDMQQTLLDLANASSSDPLSDSPPLQAWQRRLLRQPPISIRISLITQVRALDAIQRHCWQQLRVFAANACNNGPFTVENLQNRHVNNLVFALRAVLHSSPALFNHAERTKLKTIIRAPADALRMFCRLVQRTRPDKWFRVSRLQYDEIDDADMAINFLVHNSVIDTFHTGDTGVVPMSDTGGAPLSQPECVYEHLIPHVTFGMLKEFTTKINLGNTKMMRLPVGQFRTKLIELLNRQRNLMGHKLIHCASVRRIFLKIVGEWTRIKPLVVNLLRRALTVFFLDRELADPASGSILMQLRDMGRIQYAQYEVDPNAASAVLLRVADTEESMPCPTPSPGSVCSSQAISGCVAFPDRDSLIDYVDAVKSLEELSAAAPEFAHSSSSSSGSSSRQLDEDTALSIISRSRKFITQSMIDLHTEHTHATLSQSHQLACALSASLHSNVYDRLSCWLKSKAAKELKRSPESIPAEPPTNRQLNVLVKSHHSLNDRLTISIDVTSSSSSSSSDSSDDGSSANAAATTTTTTTSSSSSSDEANHSYAKQVGGLYPAFDLHTLVTNSHLPACTHDAKAGASTHDHTRFVPCSICDQEIVTELQRLLVFSRFCAVYVHATICHYGVAILERLKRHSESVTLLFQLLCSPFVPHRRGHWWNRLVLDLSKHLKRPDAALLAGRAGLYDHWVRTGNRHDLRQRTQKLWISLANGIGPQPIPLKLQRLAASLKSRVVSSTFCGRPRNCVVGQKSRFVGFGSGDIIGVEELALQWYAEEENGAWNGIHCEGRVFYVLFGMLMWRCIFATGVPNTFQSQYQSGPLDMSSELFYACRTLQFEKRLAVIHDATTVELGKMVDEAWQMHKGRNCRGVSWDRWSCKEVSDFAMCIGGSTLSHVFRALALDRRNWSGGLPDLFLWRVDESTGKYRAKLVEVKGPRDRLSHQQHAWLEFFAWVQSINQTMGIDHVMPVEVCYIVESEK
jgi:VRR-NUC domain/Fanconi-associated nuclease 1, TPR domain/FAN1, HTH domain